MKKTRCRVLLAAAGALALLAALGLNNDMRTVAYELKSAKLTAPVRVAVVSDLHSCDYGPGQRELLEAVAAAQPDLIALTGDILDDELPPENGLEAVTALAKAYPCYYVTGNHDAHLWRQVEACGATVLRGDSVRLQVRGQTLRICGVDDPRREGAWATQAQLDALAAERQEDVFSMLLAHRPAYWEQYLPGGYDLMLCGHAHGGQWRIPGLLNGLLAPDEGLFPQYAGGLYALEGGTLAVSRGLARESTRAPRLYNPPEVLVVELGPPAEE